MSIRQERQESKTTKKELEVRVTRRGNIVSLHNLKLIQQNKPNVRNKLKNEKGLIYTLYLT